jgi:hypothetical protein
MIWQEVATPPKLSIAKLGCETLHSYWHIPTLEATFQSFICSVVLAPISLPSKRRLAGSTSSSRIEDIRSTSILTTTQRYDLIFYDRLHPIKLSYSSCILFWCWILQIVGIAPSLDSTQSKQRPALLVILFNRLSAFDEYSS